MWTHWFCYAWRDYVYGEIIEDPFAEKPELLTVLFSLKPGVSQNIAMHASHAARNSS